MTGWDYVHIAIDDATRLAYVEVLSDERAPTAIAFFKRALSFFARWLWHYNHQLPHRALNRQTRQLA